MTGEHSHRLPADLGISETLVGMALYIGSLRAEDLQLQQGPLQMSRPWCCRPFYLLDLYDLLWHQQAFL